MVDLGGLLAPERVRAALPVANKKALFQHLGTISAAAWPVDARDVADRLLDRERLGSTGFGGGVAIPHGRMPGIGGVGGVFARLQSPIEYKAIDGAPVDLVFMLLSPVDAGAEHLKALAQVSRQLRDAAFVAKLRGAGSPDALFALLAPGEASDDG